MPDHGARYTDQQIDAIEKRITALYDTAYNDVRRKYLAFIQKFKREDAKYRQMLADGDITKAQYDAWLRGQVFQGERWKAQLSDIAQTLTNATIAATDVINENATNVFAMNANYAQYEIEKAGNADFGFGLYDEDTVRRLVRDDPNLLPPSKVDIPLEQQWNKTLINRQIGASIVIGEGIEAAAKRLQRAANMSANQARTHARTAMTGAQNAGRIEGYHRAERMGIKLEKEWLATLDGHTRRSHAVLDGQHVPVDKPFKSLLGEIMYPGDPSARPANVYNCRCTLISHLLDYPSQNAMRRPNLQKRGDAEVQKPIKDMTYVEWEKLKKQSAPPAKPVLQKLRDLAGKSVDGYTEEQKKTINQLLNNAPEPIRKLYEKFGSKLQPAVGRTDKKAYFSPFEGRVHMNLAEVAKGNNYKKPFDTHFHEFGHNLDALAGKPSIHWRSADGRSFEEIIFDDWKNTMVGFFKASKSNGYSETIVKKMGYGISNGSEYIQKVIERWRKGNKLTKKNADYIEILEDFANTPKTSLGLRVFWDNYFDEFAEYAYTDNKLGAIDKFCTHVKNTRNYYERADVSDMFELYAVKNAGSAYAYPFNFGHGSTYARKPNMLAAEAFAEMSAASVVNPESLDLIKQYLPNAYNAYLEMIEEVSK